MGPRRPHPPAPLSLDILPAHSGKQDRLRARGEQSHLYRGSEPPSLEESHHSPNDGTQGRGGLGGEVCGWKEVSRQVKGERREGTNSSARRRAREPP
jgi:hypothetical protein